MESIIQALLSSTEYRTINAWVRLIAPFARRVSHAYSLHRENSRCSCCLFSRTNSVVQYPRSSLIHPSSPTQSIKHSPLTLRSGTRALICPARLLPRLLLSRQMGRRGTGGRASARSYSVRRSGSTHGWRANGNVGLFATFRYARLTTPPG